MGIRSSIIVGRDNEQRVIEEGLAAARAGGGGAVFLIGEGGIGKSRLAAAAADLAYGSGMRLMRGRSSTTGPLVPYRSLTEAVMSLLRSGEAVDIDAIGPYRPVLGRLVPDLRPVTADHGDASLVVLAEAVLRLTALAGRGSGCLLTLEDLHDADPETLGVTEYLVDNLSQQPTLLLGTLRPEPCAALDLVRSVVQRGHGTLIELDRLDRPQVLQMIASYLETDARDVPAVATELVWAGSTGNPFLVEDLLTGMCDSDVLVETATGWQVQEDALANRPDTFVRSVRRRIERLPDRTRDLIMAGALLGSRFPLAVAQAVTGMPDRELLTHLQGPLAAQLVVADDQTPDWYRFQHPLVQEALLSLLEPAERTRLARRTADAVATVHPGLPGEWCQVTAALRLAGGERGAAGRLFAEAGRRCLAEGAANSAVTLLDRAWELLADEDAAARADALEPLIYALAEAGRIERALASVETVEQVAGALDERRLARLHTRLAWAAMLAGNLAEGLHRVRAARALLGPDALPADVAAVDVVAAHLELDTPGPDRLDRVEAMTRQAATVAETVPLPVVACQAWQLLGALVRQRDPAEATACLERSRVLAVEHDLPIWEIHALVRLGNDDALREADTERLEQARAQATRIGAVTARYQAEASIALQAILRCEFDRAATLIDDVRSATSRLRLLETTEYVALLRVVLAAHRGRRRNMEDALTQLEDAHGDQTRNSPRIHGLARTVCALLEENRSRAADEMSQALAADARHPTTVQLIGRYGMHLLLAALRGGTDDADPALTTALSPFRWDRQFAIFARAVLAGRAGDEERASAAVAEALRVGQPYPMGRHLGLRLVAEAALTDGWGTPVDWLRTAEEHFHSADVSAVAGACRTLLRTAGVRVSQRRTGLHRVPGRLRSAGVTVREFEVLQLLIERLSNREIAERLYLSARTVERYVSNLIVKTGMPNRIALSEFASRGYRS
ncbi:AAA family ATPase [Micromonospora sp. NPDC047074]|uniref:ATP-binding protein n=1 Tax=Micromonospora sp. NPDC047074 TaxID=3154339 RepID=UPI0033EB5160